MATFGNKSKALLATCHADLQRVLNEAIKEYDFTIISGMRTPEEQFELFKKGRAFKDGKWVKVGSTVTNLDGKTKRSKHNYNPSLAVDVAPYPIDWNDLGRFKELSEVILKCAEKLNVDLVWGGEWKSFPDRPHYQLGV
jgi:peptidoglycan L-alanyl-D-glutamate endopeptidase CwlK